MEFDFVIVGSGVAGAAVASTLLSARPTASVLMLEAGGKIKLRDFGLFQNYLLSQKLPFDRRTIFDAHMDLPYGEKERDGENLSTGKTIVPLENSRLFALGGSTTHWGGWAFRMKEEDFEPHPDLGELWPISYDQIEPYYCKAEHFLGVSGSNQVKQTVPRSSQNYPFAAFPFTREDGIFIKALNGLGYEHSHLPIARYGISENVSTHAPCQTTGTCKYCPFGARFAASNFLDDFRTANGFENFHIRSQAIAEEILLATKNRASGVRYLNKLTNQSEIASAKTIIVASGTVESTKLLMRSASLGWDHGIGNQKDNLGRYFITHPYFSFKGLLQTPDQFYQQQMGFPTLVTRHFDSADERKAGKYVLLHAAESPSRKLEGGMSNGSSFDEVISALSHNLVFKLDGMVEVFGARENRIGLLNSKNRFGLPQTHVHYDQPEGFTARLEQIQTTVTSIFQAANMKEVSIDKLSWRADHAAGTTRMSATADSGVVDANLRVHGMENLYVCSNSSLPSIGAVNPTLTLTALAIRLGELLSK
jgi:choline dehydrogenase-like flavoprotein